MSKYIDAKQLIAEIERRMEAREDVRNADDGYYPESNFTIRDKEDEEILSFIASLQNEQPEVDLEKIIGQTYHDGSVADTSDMNHVDYENIARYFYELGINARKK